MTSKYKPLIVEGEKVGDYDDTTISFDKWSVLVIATDDAFSSVGLNPLNGFMKYIVDN